MMTPSCCRHTRCLWSVVVGKGLSRATRGSQPPGGVTSSGTMWRKVRRCHRAVVVTPGVCDEYLTNACCRLAPVARHEFKGVPQDESGWFWKQERRRNCYNFFFFFLDKQDRCWQRKKEIRKGQHAQKQQELRTTDSILTEIRYLVCKIRLWAKKQLFPQPNLNSFAGSCSFLEKIKPHWNLVTAFCNHAQEKIKPIEISS